MSIGCWCELGRIRPRTGRASPGRPPGRVLLLVGARRPGAGSSRHAWPAAARLRVQAYGHAASYGFHALGDAASRARPPGRRACGPRHLSPGRGYPGSGRRGHPVRNRAALTLARRARSRLAAPGTASRLPAGQNPSEAVSRLTSPAAVITPVSGSRQVTVGAPARQFQRPHERTSWPMARNASAVSAGIRSSM